MLKWIQIFISLFHYVLVIIWLTLSSMCSIFKASKLNSQNAFYTVRCLVQTGIKFTVHYVALYTKIGHFLKSDWTSGYISVYNNMLRLFPQLTANKFIIVKSQLQTDLVMVVSASTMKGTNTHASGVNKSRNTQIRRKWKASSFNKPASSFCWNKT